jgi:hypothetical protein
MRMAFTGPAVVWLSAAEQAPYHGGTGHGKLFHAQDDCFLDRSVTEAADANFAAHYSFAQWSIGR